MKQPKKSDVDTAIDQWIVTMGVPLIAHDTVRRKFKRLKLTPDQIRDKIK